MPRKTKSATTIAKGRRHTDKSLGAERAKADDSLDDRREATQAGADRAVERSRDKTDEQSDAVRDKADRAVKSARAGKPSSIAQERRDADKRLVAERASTDRIVEAERDRTDEATDRERADTEAANRDFFRAERKVTDRDLSREREFIDAETRRAADVLDAAAAAHNLTRGDLLLRDDFLSLLGKHLRQPMLQIAVAADRLKNSIHVQQASADDRSQVEEIFKNSQEVLRLVGDLLERVEVWQPPAQSVARSSSGRTVSRAAKHR